MTELENWDADVLVVGAGPAGLTAAIRLMDRGFDVRIVEAGNSAGGMARSRMVDGFLLEQGPQTFTGSSRRVWEILERLGLQEEVVKVEGPARRYLFHRNHLRALPMGPWSALVGNYLSPSAKLRLLMEPWVPQAPDPAESVSAFFERRIGGEAARVLAGSFVSGVYAGDPEQLGARAAFPTLWGWELEHGSLWRGFRNRTVEPERRGLFSLRRGLGHLGNRAAEILGARLSLEEPIHDLGRIDGGFRISSSRGTLRTRSVLLATPVHVASRITNGIDRSVSSLLSEVGSAPLAVIHRAGTKGAGLCPGFGVLVPRGQGLRTLGIQFSGALFPERMPTDTCWLHTHFVGGALDEGVLDLGDDEIIEVARSEADQILPIPLSAEWSEVTRYPQAIPQLDRSHPERLDALRGALQEVPGLDIAGSYVGGVGLEGAVDSGICAASRLSGWLDKQGTRAA